MMLTNKQYRARDEGSCPFCNSQDLEWHNLDFDGKYAKHEVSCLDCEKEWYDVYKLRGYEER